MSISASNFWPKPKVDSMLLEIIPHKKPENWAKIKQIIDLIFNYPNKKLSKVAKIVKIDVPEELQDLRIRQMGKKELVLVVNYLK